MPPVIDHGDESEDAVQPTGEWNIKITVPEEYTGHVIDQLMARGGTTKSMDAQRGEVTIHPALPPRQYEAMAKLIARLSGRTAGRIQREAGS